MPVRRSSIRRADAGSRGSLKAPASRSQMGGHQVLRRHMREASLQQTGYIDHIGIGVPDLVAAKQYYDDLMAVLGLREWFDTGPGDPSTMAPTVVSARSCSSIKPSNPARTRAASGASPPRIPGLEPRRRSRSTRVGSCTRRGRPGRATRVPPVRRALLCHLLGRSSRVQARGGLPQSRGELVLVGRRTHRRRERL